MSDDARTYVFPNVKNTGDVLQLWPPQPLRGLTIINQSSVTVSVFKNGLASANAVPDFKVYPGTFQATPLPQPSTCALRFDGSTATSSGQVYAHFTTDLVAASSGSAATSAPVSSKPFAVVSEGSNLVVPGTFVDSNGRTVAYWEFLNGSGFSSPAGGSANVFLLSLFVSGLPRHVVAGVAFTSVSPSPFGWVPLITGNGLWEVASPLQYGTLGASSPRGFMCFSNYDDLLQLRFACNAALAGYTQ